MRTPVQRFASRGFVFISRVIIQCSVIIGLGSYPSSSGAVPLPRELDPLFRSEVRKPPIRVGRTEHLARLGEVVWTRGWTCLGSPGQRSGAVRIKIGAMWRFNAEAHPRFVERLRAPGHPAEPQSPCGEQRRYCQGQMFCFHCFCFLIQGDDSFIVATGIVHGFPGGGFRFGTKTGNSGAKRE